MGNNCFTSPKAYHVFYVYFLDIILSFLFSLTIVIVSVYNENTDPREYIFTSSVIIFSCIQSFSYALVMWRFFDTGLTPASYIKFDILQKREDRCKVALSFLLVIQGILLCFYGMALYVVEKINPFSTAKFIIRIITIFMTTFLLIFKMKFAVYFFSRALQISSCFTLVLLLLNVVDFVDCVLILKDVTRATLFLSFVIIGFISMYSGVFSLLVSALENHAKFWRISWWINDPILEESSSVDITTKEYWENVKKERQFKLLWFSPPETFDLSFISHDTSFVDNKRQFSSLWFKHSHRFHDENNNTEEESHHTPAPQEERHHRDRTNNKHQKNKLKSPSKTKTHEHNKRQRSRTESNANIPRKNLSNDSNSLDALESQQQRMNSNDILEYSRNCSEDNNIQDSALFPTLSTMQRTANHHNNDRVLFRFSVDSTGSL